MAPSNLNPLNPKILKRIQKQINKTDDFEVDHLKELLKNDPSDTVVDDLSGSFEFSYRGKIYRFVSRLGMLITGEYNGKLKKVNEMARTFKWI